MMVRCMSESGLYWQCNGCEYGSKKKSNLIDHIEAKHTVGGALACTFCGHLATNRRGLRNHHYQRHKDIPFNMQRVHS